MLFIYLSSVSWIAFVIGYYVGHAHVTRKVFKLSCEKIENRHDYEACTRSVQSFLDKDRP